MDWSGVIRQIIGLGLPVLGTALGGPLGGSVATIIANALGTTATPAAVSQAIDTSGAEVAIQKLKSAEAEYVAKIQAEAATQQTMLTEVGQTMRAELGANPQGWFDFFQRGWRPALAWEMLVEMIAGLVLFFHEAWTGDFQTLNALMQFSGFLTWYLGGKFAVLGVVVAGRSAEKVAEIKTNVAAPENNVITRTLDAVRKGLGR